MLGWNKQMFTKRGIFWFWMCYIHFYLFSFLIFIFWYICLKLLIYWLQINNPVITKVTEFLKNNPITTRGGGVDSPRQFLKRIILNFLINIVRYIFVLQF